MLCYDAVLHLHSFMGNVWSETLNCQRHENIEGHGQEPAIESIILEMERIFQRKRRREWQPRDESLASHLHCIAFSKKQERNSSSVGSAEQSRTKECKNQEVAVYVAGLGLCPARLQLDEPTIK